MNVQKIIQVFNEKHEVHFKLYSLEYTIIGNDKEVFIYADLYSKIKSKYNSIEELLKEYTVYNESIDSNDDRIEKIS